MFECVYTRKARKAKWCDGFVDRRGSAIVLLDEDKKSVCTSSFAVLEDESIDTPAYLILTDFLGELIDVTSKPSSATDTPKKYKTEPKLQGRTPSQILDLLDSDTLV